MCNMKELVSFAFTKDLLYIRTRSFGWGIEEGVTSQWWQFPTFGMNFLILVSIDTWESVE